MSNTGIHSDKGSAHSNPKADEKLSEWFSQKSVLEHCNKSEDQDTEQSFGKKNATLHKHTQTQVQMGNYEILGKKKEIKKERERTKKEIGGWEREDGEARKMKLRPYSLSSQLFSNGRTLELEFRIPILIPHHSRRVAIIAKAVAEDRIGRDWQFRRSIRQRGHGLQSAREGRASGIGCAGEEIWAANAAQDRSRSGREDGEGQTLIRWGGGEKSSQ
ncbi:hypothetical protein ACLOJK_037819 [Asimina triloba]